MGVVNREGDFLAVPLLKEERKRTRGQVARDRALVMEWHCVGFSLLQIERKLAKVTAPEGYTLAGGKIQDIIHTELQKLDARVELSKHTHRQMMVYRLNRRRAQLEEIIEDAQQDQVESQVRRRDIHGSGTKVGRVPVGGYTEAVEKKRKGRAPITAFEQLNAIDRLEMDLLGLALEKDSVSDVDPETGGVSVAPKVIDYNDAARIMIEAMVGNGTVTPRVIEEEPDPEVVEARFHAD